MPALTAAASAALAPPRSRHGAGRCAAAARGSTAQLRRRQPTLAAAGLASAAPLAFLPEGAQASEAFVDLTPGVTAQPAAASDAAAAAAGEALAAVQGAVAANEQTDLVFTVLFTIAVGALTVVTVGVAYLSFISWNDSRLESEDRSRFDANGLRSSGGNGASPVNPKKAGKQAKAAKDSKGFGSKK